LFFPLLRKWSLVLGNCHQVLFLEPFSFLFILFRFCIVLVIFPSFALKIVLGNCQKELVLEPFSLFFSCFFSFWLVFLLCLQNWPWKLSKGTFSRTLFVFSFSFWLVFLLCLQKWPWKLSEGVFSRALFVFFSSCAFKTDFRNCQNDFFLEPLSFFFVFFSLQNWLQKLSKRVFSRTLVVIFFVFCLDIKCT
jgi:hypothetical protein